MPPDAERYLDGSGVSTAMTFNDEDIGPVPQLRLLTDDINNNSSNDEGESRDINVAELVEEATKKPNDFGLAHNEVLIDGVVYDIASFHHPGGDQIFLFGGNDVTVQYKMIHPYATDNFLKKMRVVRKVEKYESEYSWDTPFERELKREVAKIVPWWKATATPGFYFRVLFYTVWFWSCQYLWIMHPTTYVLSVIFGVGHAMVGLNIQHDANHGSVARKFENVWINDFLGFGADWIGSSKWLWQQQHWTHHAYTNQDRDPDLHSAEPLVIFQRYAPDSEHRKWHHPYQVYYYFVALAFYGLAILSSMDFFTLNHSGATLTGLMNFDTPYIRRRAYVSTFTHVLYCIFNLGGPVYYHGFTFKAFSYIFIMVASASLSLAVPFSVSHNFEGVQQQYNLSNPNANKPRNDDDDDEDEAFVYCPETNYPPCWYRSQIETGCTYGGAISGYVTGGLNFQIEHHLFPRMNSAWYPYIQPAIRKVCKKHGIKYTFFPYIHENLWSMCNFMHSNGRAHIVAAEEKARAEAEGAALSVAAPKAKSE